MEEGMEGGKERRKDGGREIMGSKREGGITSVSRGLTESCAGSATRDEGL